MKGIGFSALVLSLTLAGGIVPANAQSAAVSELLEPATQSAQVLLLGTFHFANPGRDRYQPKFTIDMLDAEHQRQIEEVVGRLAAYRPTKVAVEWERERQGVLDSLYREYRADRLPPRSNEVYQLGFRLAARLGHDRVYAVDVEREEALIAIARAREAELEAADSADTEWSARYRRLYSRDDSLKTVQPLREHLRYLNSADRIRAGHGAYLVRLFKAGGDSSYAGPDFVAGWYDRNLRIFRNLQRITESPGERLAVIYGAGHLATLRHLVESSPEYVLVEAGRYLD